jgi:hypothetical protein
MLAQFRNVLHVYHKSINFNGKTLKLNGKTLTRNGKTLKYNGNIIVMLTCNARHYISININKNALNSMVS